jgi:hypothetical protein
MKDIFTEIILLCRKKRKTTKGTREKKIQKLLYIFVPQFYEEFRA